MYACQYKHCVSAGAERKIAEQKFWEVKLCLWQTFISQLLNILPSSYSSAIDIKSFCLCYVCMFDKHIWDRYRIFQAVSYKWSVGWALVFHLNKP